MEKPKGVRAALALAGRTRRAPGRSIVARPAPPPPEPQTVPHPQPRVVWSSPDGRLCGVARDWEDGHRPTYTIMARARPTEPWRPAGGEECWECLCAVLRWIDQQQRHG